MSNRNETENGGNYTAQDARFAEERCARSADLAVVSQTQQDNQSLPALQGPFPHGHDVMGDDSRSPPPSRHRNSASRSRQEEFLDDYEQEEDEAEDFEDVSDPDPYYDLRSGHAPRMDPRYESAQASHGLGARPKVRVGDNDELVRSVQDKIDNHMNSTHPKVILRKRSSSGKRQGNTSAFVSNQPQPIDPNSIDPMTVMAKMQSDFSRMQIDYSNMFNYLSGQANSNKQTQPKSPKKPATVQVPRSLVYDGHGDWANFELRLRRFIKIHNLTEYDAYVFHISLTLKDQASLFWEKLIHKCEVSKKQPTLDALLLELKNRYDTPVQTLSATIEYERAKQFVGESAQAFSERLWDLGEAAFPNLPEALLESMLVTKFAFGLEDKNASKYLFERACTTMQQARQALRLFNDIDSNLKPKHSYESNSVTVPNEQVMVAQQLVQPVQQQQHRMQQQPMQQQQQRMLQQPMQQQQQRMQQQHTQQQADSVFVQQLAPQANSINELSSTVKEVFSFVKKMDSRICRRLDDLDIRVEKMESDLRKLRTPHSSSRRAHSPHPSAQFQKSANSGYRSRVSSKSPHGSRDRGGHESRVTSRHQHRERGRSNSASRRCYACKSEDHLIKDCPDRHVSIEDPGTDYEDAENDPN